MRASAIILVATLLAGCGHSQLSYTPKAPSNVSLQQIASIVEQGFYEDYGQQKPQSALVTEEFIALSNGSVTRGLTTGSAQAFGGVVIGIRSTYLRTEEINQRIYYRNLGVPIVSKRNGRDNRYAVTIRTAEHTTARNVYFRSQDRAQQFADALVYLRDYGATSRAVAPTSATIDIPSEAAYREQQLQDLRSKNLPYDEYQKQYRAIMGL